jgi:cyanophycin synthetase
MSEFVKVNSLRLLPGVAAGLAQKTALLDIEVASCSAEWPARGTVPQASLAALLPGVDIPVPLKLDGVSVVAADVWPAAFLLNPDQGSRFARWLVALAVAMQRQARDPVWQGRILGEEAGRIVVALPWEREEVLKAALRFTLSALARWSRLETWGTSADAEPYRRWLANMQAGGVAPNSLRFADAAHVRGISVRVRGHMLSLGWGRRQKWLDSSFTNHTSNIATRVAKEKYLASQLMAEAGLPVPPSRQFKNHEQALAYAKKLGWPVVIKPASLDQGRAVVPDIRDADQFRRAFEAALACGTGVVLVEKHVPGEDHRMLVVGGRLRMVSRRTPGGVLGDGAHDIATLLAITNTDPRRGSDPRSLMMKLVLDDEARDCLAEQQLEPTSVPEPGRFVPLRRTANISTGGTADDVTTTVHPDNQVLAERAARIVGLDIAGVDFLCPDVSRSWHEVGGAICEVNAQPGFRPHWLGDPERDINGEIVDWLCAGGTARIPVALVLDDSTSAGTAIVLHRQLSSNGRIASLSCRHGVWIGKHKVHSRGGINGACMTLVDPATEVAVMQMRSTVLRGHGHPCDRYDVVVLADIANQSATEPASSQLQLRLVMAAPDHGLCDTLLVNAENPRCVELARQLSARRICMVARTAGHPVLTAHRQHGGDTVYLRPEGDGVVPMHEQGNGKMSVISMDRYSPDLAKEAGLNVLLALAAIKVAGMSK